MWDLAKVWLRACFKKSACSALVSLLGIQMLLGHAIMASADDEIEMMEFTWPAAAQLQIIFKKYAKWNLTNASYDEDNSIFLDTLSELLDPSQFVEIPSGRYLLGATIDNKKWPNEALRFKHVDSFFIQRTQVTQLLWFLVFQDSAKSSLRNPSYFKEEKYCIDSFSTQQSVRKGGNKFFKQKTALCPSLPVEQVSKQLITDTFIPALNQKMIELEALKGRPFPRFRLPNGAEWEISAQGAELSLRQRDRTPTAYFFGNSVESGDKYIWHAGNSDQQTHPVTSLSPNHLGIFITGNVSEWVEESDIHGGSWYDAIEFSRTAFHIDCRPDRFNSKIGFRLVMIPPKDVQENVPFQGRS